MMKVCMNATLSVIAWVRGARTDGRTDGQHLLDLLAPTHPRNHVQCGCWASCWLVSVVGWLFGWPVRQ